MKTTAAPIFEIPTTFLSIEHRPPKGTDLFELLFASYGGCQPPGKPTPFQTEPPFEGGIFGEGPAALMGIRVLVSVNLTDPALIAGDLDEEDARNRKSRLLETKGLLISAAQQNYELSIIDGDNGTWMTRQLEYFTHLKRTPVPPLAWRRWQSRMELKLTPVEVDKVVHPFDLKASAAIIVRSFWTKPTEKEV